jgi:hypothetical protein
MLAVVPFNWPAHDTHFVVGHFHYVLIGGVVFPLFAGWVPADRWRRLLGSHAGRHRLLGVNPHVYPLDFASFIRLRPALEGLPTRAPMPPPLGLDHFDEFLRVHGRRYAVSVRAAAEFEAA